MSKHLLFIVSFLAATSVSQDTSGQSRASVCDLPVWFQQLDTETTGAAQNRRTVVLKRNVLGDSNAVIFSEKMKINADATLRAYSGIDLDGSRCRGLPTTADPVQNGCSMGHIANGVSGTRLENGRAVALSSSQLTQAFRSARAAGWPKDFPVKFNFFALNTQPGVVGRQIGRIPCETLEGFLTSQAATRSGLQPENFGQLPPSCDPRVYLDAVVPSVVVPLCWSKRARDRNPDRCPSTLGLPQSLDVRPGALAAVRDQTGQVHFAVVGDLGPPKKLGEVSVGLASAVVGTNLPRTYQELKVMGDRKMDVIVFPDEIYQGVLIPAQVPEMSAKSRAAFQSWQGSFESSAVKLRDCGSLAGRQ